ncbi:MAG: hypothetical protein JWP01_2309 [Myxococcales bacterium]|nr:hypothetical protein [Myxococcales bacterium]
MIAGVLVRLNLTILSLATALHAFDERLFAVRLSSTVQPDSLIHYNMLLAWWRHGDSPRGFTLTPSPYFIDMLIEFPIMLLAPDFERFSYALACAYALLIFASLYLILRIALECGPTFAIAVTAVSIVAFYKLAPWHFITHVFVVNHTSELFTTLGVLALVHAWFRPSAPRRSYAPYVYALVVTACVASSPFFIATYCVPSAIAAVAILGTEYLNRRRLIWFLGLTAIGAMVGLISLAILSRYAWPVRNDHYQVWWKSYRTFRHTLIAEAGGIRVFWATVVAMAASTGLVIAGRRNRRWSLSTTFLLAFLPACVVASVGIPIKRGAFDGAYAFRYVTLPWLLVVSFYVATAARLAKSVVVAVLRRRPHRPTPRWLPWCATSLGAAGIALISTFHGSLTMYDDASWTSPTIRCFRDAEQRGDVRDGLATWALGRYLNAARYAPDWSSPHVIVQMRVQPEHPPSVDPRDNNLVWFDRSYRGGNGQLNFVATHLLLDDDLRFFRDRIGVPDRTITCPTPINFRFDGKPTFELWIWDRVDAQRKLSDLVMHDNLRSPFAPVIGDSRMSIDPIWGMRGVPAMSELVDGHRVWRRSAHRADEMFAAINAMWLPSGHYRLELDVSTVASADGAAPVAEVQVHQELHGEIARFSIAARTSHAAFDLDIVSRGGATSGDAIEVYLYAREAELIEISGATLTLVEPQGIDPFQIFR